MSEKARFAERLKDALTRAGYELKPVVLQKQFNTRWDGRGISFQAARAWLIGTSVPQADKLKVLAEWLRVPPGELLYGEPKAREVREPRADWASSISAQDRAAIEAFLALSPAQRRAVADLIRGLAARS